MMVNTDVVVVDDRDTCFKELGCVMNDWFRFEDHITVVGAS